MNRRAFSLPELMIVLLILCIGGMLIIPTAAPTATIRADAAARILRADLEYAQVRTISNPDQPVALVVDDTGTGWWLADPESPTVPIIREGTDEPYRVILGEGRAQAAGGVAVDVEQLPDGTLQFDTLGGIEGLAVDPKYSFRCEDAEVQLSVRAGTGFIDLHR
jgi:prepilin-type N-terminal cleavage/methylation domain-containing protein